MRNQGKKGNLFEFIITPDQLADEVAEINGHGEFALAIINLLSEKAFEDCHIKGSINIEAASLADTVDDWDRARPIVLYEAEDDIALSEKAFNLLNDMGFIDVRILEGGMKEWLDKGYPTGGPCKM